MRTTHNIFTLGDLKATRKQQFCHKLVSGWRLERHFTQRTEHELVEEAKRYSPGAVGISSTKHRSF